MRSTIICVDDEKMLLNILSEQLTSWFGNNYIIEKALNGEEALEIIDDCIENGQNISVVISDYIMPNMKGDELLEQVNKRDPRIKKIMLTGYSSIEGIVGAINRAGLYRYITKPWDNKDLMLTILEAIKSYEQEKKSTELAKGFETLYHKYEKLYRNFESGFENAIDTLSRAIEVRNATHFGHSKRVAQYSGFIGKAIDMSESELKYLRYMAVLHDVGKIGMTDSEVAELRKLSGDDRKPLIERQIKFSEDILSYMSESERLLRGVKYHYENFDGTGFFGTKSEAIPVEARIIRVANFFDNLKNTSTEDTGKEKVTLDEAVAALTENKGTLLDPTLVDVFVGILKPKVVSN